MMCARTYGNLSFSPEKQKWVVEKLEPHVALRFKQIFPRVPKHSAGPFHLNANMDTAADLRWFTERYPLITPSDDRDLLESHSSTFYHEQAEAERIFLPEWSPTVRPGLKVGQAFRKYQLQALDLIEKVKTLILVDAIGLGKTYEGLGVALLPNTLPLVAVVEPHLQTQWREKAESFINLRIDTPKGNTPYDLPKADIYIFKYTQLSGWVDVLSAGWVKAIVFDEIQQLRTGLSSAKGSAARDICQGIETRIGLTGTPVYNYGIDAFNILDTAIRPGILGSKEDFSREWCTDDGSRRGIVRDPDALGTYLREAHVFLRRTKRDVGQEAKQKSPHIEWVELDAMAVEDSERLAEQLAIKTLSGSFNESGQAAREFDLRLPEMTGIAKARATAGFVRMFVESGAPTLLFGYHREVYRIWAQELSDLNPLFYTGSENAAQKERSKKDFIAGKSDLLIMSLRSGAGADGIQHRCSNVVYGEFDWSPKVHEQCTGRVDRDGQLEEVYASYVATNYGSDPVMIDVLGLKASQSQGIVDPGVKSNHYQTDTNRIKRLAAEYLKAKGLEVPIRTRMDDSRHMDIQFEELALI